QQRIGPRQTEQEDERCYPASRGHQRQGSEATQDFEGIDAQLEQVASHPKLTPASNPGKSEIHRSPPSGRSSTAMRIGSDRHALANASRMASTSPSRPS